MTHRPKKDTVQRNYNIAFVVAPSTLALVAFTSHLVPWWGQAGYLIGLCVTWAFFGWASACQHFAETIAGWLEDEQNDNQN